jgi:hypothetical protein
MISRQVYSAMAALVCAGLGSQWSFASGAPPAIPQDLAPPAGEQLKLRLSAKGVQIYQCQGGEWKFQAPEATLFDHHGKKVGKHYAGPTWESKDGSTVVGELKAKDDGPDSKAIPWLLLHAKSNTGHGLFSSVSSIQRLQTHGGKAPSQGCDASSADQTVRVPYRASYYFYTSQP